ncbi:nuclear matrix protein [Lindgomyces ingoldianus]|uniref:Nuclear matrix protein n=1 Tax=Lindgomyces ingoldianus TaxID=673940 RepID=A0ACB6R3Q0_9PLEO|nr:nuclear matrix protein [Lindgomyces ingoldianus]KAF2473142.1 nuclear matrix protein [Lindgomyces ingoldianus]
MAASDTALVGATTAKLEELLQRARTIKQATSIDPPLQVSKLATNNESLLGPTVEASDSHMIAIEGAAKHVFYSILASALIDDPSFVSIWNLLDILQYCGDRDECSSSLVLLLIEELLDDRDLDGCKIVFNYLESRRETIIAHNSKNKDLVILRSCNELLRRLSRADDAVFCGRVYVFLFQSFPLGDKSSVNLRGTFHVENVTTFEDYLKTEDEDEDSMQVDSSLSVKDVKDARSTPKSEERDSKLTTVKPEGQKSTAMDINELYSYFWSMQGSFSNPPRLFEGDNFKQFQKNLEATLTKFKEVPKVIQTGDSDSKRGTKRKLDDDNNELASTFNPKYLTSRDLFKLELSDLAFQRHILVQALILIDFLFSLTEKAKKKPYYLNAQKAMQYSYTLRDEDAEWALGIKNSIANYLQDGPDGKFYYRMVDTVLSRDKNWVRWKMENCQPFTRDRVPTKDFLVAKSGASKGVNSRKISKPWSEDGTLGFLSSTDDEKGLRQLRQLKLAQRLDVPSAETYVSRVPFTEPGQEIDQEMVTSEEEKRQKEEHKTSNTWRALRIASRSRLSLFDRLEDGKPLERLFQPVTSIEAAGEDNAPTGPEGRDSVPQEQHQSVEEQRADQRSQVTADAAAE